MFNDIFNHIRTCYPDNNGFIPLHAPTFAANEQKYVKECIESTFVSSVGTFVNKAEELICNITGSKFAIAVVNGTNALQVALLLAGVEKGHEVITQSLTFIATSNAISYLNAEPHYIDVDTDTLGMSPDALLTRLEEISELKPDGCYNKFTGKKISACIPMHTFGFPCRIKKIKEICDKFKISVVEDAAESLGSETDGKHTGTFGKLGVFSFNGNKIVTSGGGGMIITNDKNLAIRAKHLTTTAKIPHAWLYEHDEIGYNFRMPNLNAALLCAQLEQLDGFIISKRKMAKIHTNFFSERDECYITETEGAKANYWLNTLILKNDTDRDIFLENANKQGIMCRPIWSLNHTLKMYSYCQHGNLTNSIGLEKKVINFPSSAN